LLFSYNSIVNTTFRFVNCYAIGDNESYVASAPAISCQSAEYQSLLPLIIVIQVVVVGLSPLLIVLFMYHIRKRLEEKAILSRYGVLFQYYRPYALSLFPLPFLFFSFFQPFSIRLSVVFLFSDLCFSGKASSSLVASFSSV
jgi:hypothetical protein